MAGRIASALLFLALSTSPALAFGAGDDGCSTANQVTAGTYTGLHTYGQWDFPTTITHDPDWYRFTVQPGMRMDVDFHVVQTGGSPNYYIFMRAFEADPVTCAGAVVDTSFQLHVSATNATPLPKDYLMFCYAGVTGSQQSVFVTYDLVLSASTAQTSIAYCPGSPNSLGLSGTLSVTGSASIAADDLIFHGSNLPPSTSTLLAMGGTVNDVPFGDGMLCIGSPLHRLHHAAANASGACDIPLAIQLLPGGAGIAAGSARYFQLYYRNLGGPLGTGFNLTNALAVTFTP